MLEINIALPLYSRPIPFSPKISACFSDFLCKYFYGWKNRAGNPAIPQNFPFLPSMTLSHHEPLLSSCLSVEVQNQSTLPVCHF